jgi:hypothetical protein
MTPCKHLDHTEGKYGPDITLETAAPHYPEVKFWRRGPTWTDNGPGHPPNPSKVQFCGAGRGRINGVFDCYQKPGPMNCYEPADPKPEP